MNPGFFAGWKPFDGKILLEEDALATVRITLEPRDTELGVQTRHMDWRFTKVKGAWKAWSWERWISPAEKRGELKPGVTVVEATSGNTGIAVACA